MTCPICGQGELRPGTTTFAADADEAVVVVRNGGQAKTKVGREHGC